MDAREFANKLGIQQEGVFKDKVYTINLQNSNNYSKAYTILDKSDLVDLDIENMSMTDEETSMLYLADDFDITLYANFNDNVYTLTLEEVND